MRIDGLAALVTGGGSGLGAATAAHLAALGCRRVAVVDINRAAAEASAAAIGGVGVGCDVAWMRRIRGGGVRSGSGGALGRCGSLVNCAGIGTAGRIVGRDGPIKLEAYERVIRVNLIGTFNMLRLAAAEMSRGRCAGGRRTGGDCEYHGLDRGAYEGRLGSRLMRRQRVAWWR